LADEDIVLSSPHMFIPEQPVTRNWRQCRWVRNGFRNVWRSWRRKCG
jgi:hypothetical protein